MDTYHTNTPLDDTNRGVSGSFIVNAYLSVGT